MRNDSLWFKKAVIYELHVRSFCDSTGDGIGDFPGLTEKLGYLEELGVTALWLLPFYPSPLRDDGYDIADYYAVNSSYGTLKDFEKFLAEAHRRGLRVITELVINHTSDQNPWFQRARRAPPGSSERDFYVWSDTPERFSDARIIFRDFETSNWAWDAEAKAYYWHRFYSHQPDLNFDNPAVRQEVFNVVDFWLGMGVDGLRLDAVPYLFEREGTSCENLPETHEYLRQLRKHVDEKFPERVLLAEANQWPEDAVAYFGKGDQSHMAFHFPLMPRIFMGLQMEDRFPIVDILDQTPPIPSNCQWAIFLRNHDELTLEMVTDEERDYMYRIYAEDAKARINFGIRRRLAPLLGSNRRKIELINSLLLSLPGTPIIYYGDEIGMGDNFYLGDRNGVRTPMQWSADRNAGFSRANPQQLFLPVIIDPEFHYETVNVDMQSKNLSSLLWWMRRILGVRQRHEAFALGTLEFLNTENAKVLAFLRTWGDQTVLVVANLSRFAQPVRLDLSRFSHCQPEELFGMVRFPEISDAPYTLTLGPHGFYWLSLQLSSNNANTDEERKQPILLNIASQWSEELCKALERIVLPSYIKSCRWFGGKDKTLRDIQILTSFFADEVRDTRMMLVQVSFSDGTAVTHALPLAIKNAGDAESLEAQALVARFADGSILCDALYLPHFRTQLLQLATTSQIWRDDGAWLAGSCMHGLLESCKTSRVLVADHSNTSVVYDDKVLLKILRRFEAGLHAEADILKALEEEKGASAAHVPRYLGEIRCRMGNVEGTLGVFTEFVPNEGDGWTYTLDALKRYFERVMTIPQKQENPLPVDDVIGGNYPERAHQLGKRTGELHLALEALKGVNFAPEPFTTLYQRSLYQSMRNLARRTESELVWRLSILDASVKEEARAWLSVSGELLNIYGELLKRRISATKIRVHGDFHLGQVLNTGKDFVIIDFEGEPRRPLGERLLKRSPLVDVAGMLRSFDYAAQITLMQEQPENRKRLESWAQGWLEKISRTFLNGYLESTKGASFLPQIKDDFDLLLRLFLLDKAVYEIGYELNYRPDFLLIPLKACRKMLEASHF